jgi:hypothetical protein
MKLTIFVYVKTTHLKSISMNVNLKQVAQQRMGLEHLLENKQDLAKVIKPKLIRDLVRFLEEVERDLEMAGESITELDMPRLEAIEERNKMLAFKKYGYGE